LFESESDSDSDLVVVAANSKTVLPGRRGRKANAAGK
jgi:hypothetical protein